MLWHDDIGPCLDGEAFGVLVPFVVEALYRWFREKRAPVFCCVGAEVDVIIHVEIMPSSHKFILPLLVCASASPLCFDTEASCFWMGASASGILGFGLTIIT